LPIDKPTRKRLLLRLFKVAVLVAVVWLVRGTIIDAVERLREHRPTVDYRWLLLAGLLYYVSTLPAACFWHRILRALGQRPRFMESLRAFTIGHLGKYVPGKAMVVVLRSGLVSGARVSPTVAGASVFLETLTMMAVGGFLAAAILWILYPGQWLYVLLAVALMTGAGLPTLPPIFRWLAGRVPARGVEEDTVVPLEQINFPLLAAGWLGMMLGWILMGASLWATLRSLQIDASLVADLPLWTATVALAMVAGFLSLIPGGLFVRDAILAQLLAMASPVGEAQAVVAAILLRLVCILAELTASVILYVFGPRPAPTHPPAPGSSVDQRQAPDART